MKTIAVPILLFLFSNAAAQSPCATTNNYFDANGQRSSDQKVTGSDDGKKLVMDDSFEIITLVLGSLPDSTGTADFTIVNHDATPGDGEIAVTYFYYSGNAEETMELRDSGKTARVCLNNGRISVKWNGVNFQGKVNGNITYKTACEMSGGN